MGRQIAYLLLSTILAGGLFIQLGSVINHDTAWYLYAGERFLDGGRLYRDVFVDVNPPLGFFLTLPAAALARMTGLFSIDLFFIYGFALIVTSLAATRQILRADTGLSPILRRGFMVLAALAMTACSMGEFGQREHFLVVLTLPYLSLVALRASGASVARPLAIVVGVSAALGFALKPHFLVLPVLLEVYRAMATRRFRAVVRPETLALAGGGLLYVAAVLIFMPEYPARIVPYALEVYNSAFRYPLWVVLLRPETVLLPLGVGAYLYVRRSITNPALIDVLCITAVCTFAAYVVQAKGWRYQLYPITATLFLGLSYYCLAQWHERLRGQRPVGRRLVLRLAMAALAFVVLIGTLVIRGGYQNRLMTAFLPHVQAYASEQSILVLSSNVSAGFPMVNYSGVGWSSRFPTLWLLPGIQLRRHAKEGADRPLFDEIDRYTRDSVVADLAQQPPALVIVDDRAKKSYFGTMTFDYLEFFLEDPRFARIWADYEWLGNEGDYRLYRRRCIPER